MNEISFLPRPEGHRIAYQRLPGRLPGIMFLGGFRSDMTGEKANALAEFCREQGRAFVRFDYFGHGQSSGDFTDGTIGRWKEDALAVLEELTEGPQILVGSSMGGWIMLLAALARRERVAGLLGLAAAPDFTEDLIFEAFSPEQKGEFVREGRVYLPSCYGQEPYPITRGLIEEARGHLLLRQEAIPLTCPVRLLHGLQDEDVPHAYSLTLSEKLEGADVRTTLVKDGTHRLSRPQDLSLLCEMLKEL